MSMSYKYNFIYQGARHSISFRSAYDGRAFYDVDPDSPAGFEIAVTMKGPRPDPRPMYRADADRVKFARAAYAAYRAGQHSEWRTECPRRGYKNIGVMLRIARRGVQHGNA